jgi:hypothetical protein
MNAPDYLSRLRRKNQQQGHHAGTAQTDKMTLRGLCSSSSIPKNPIFPEAETIGAGDSATASSWSLIHHPCRDPLEAVCGSLATPADSLARFPDAAAAEPFVPTIRRPPTPMTAEAEAAVRAWLALIEETDPAIISEVMDQCHRDAAARDFFLGRAAAELPKPDPLPDDRRTCGQCANLIAQRCQAAKRGEIAASRNYRPIPDLPRRCEGYAPGADDTDRRPGRDRWPGLIQDAKGANDSVAK